MTSIVQKLFTSSISILILIPILPREQSLLFVHSDLLRDYPIMYYVGLILIFLYIVLSLFRKEKSCENNFDENVTKPIIAASLFTFFFYVIITMFLWYIFKITFTGVFAKANYLYFVFFTLLVKNISHRSIGMYCMKLQYKNESIKDSLRIMLYNFYCISPLYVLLLSPHLRGLIFFTYVVYTIPLSIFLDIVLSFILRKKTLFLLQLFGIKVCKTF